MCYFGLLRSGELTVQSLNSYCPQSHLSMNDVSDDRTGRPKIIHLTLKVSKTDPFRKGVTISVDRTGKPLCQVVAELAYLAVQGDQDGPLFQHHDQRPLTKAAFVDQVRRTLTLMLVWTTKITLATASGSGRLPQQQSRELMTP